MHNGKPYLDKPRLFLKERDFKQEDDNAFYINGNTIARRDGGLESKLRVEKDGLIFKNSLVRVSLTLEFKVKEMTLKSAFGGTISLQKAAEMALVFKGITTSLKFLVDDSLKL